MILTLPSLSSSAAATQPVPLMMQLRLNRRCCFWCVYDVVEPKNQPKLVV